MILTQASWIILSVLAAICMGGFLLVSQYFKTPGQYLVIWSRLMVLAALAPLPFFLPWPEDPRFYIAVGITGFIASWADLNVMNVSARLGGGVVSRLQPLGIGIAFVLWLIVKPEQWDMYAANPLHTFGILIALGGCIYFSMALRHCTVSASAMRALILPISGYAVNIIIAKYAFDITPFHDGVFYYMLVQCLTAIPFILCYSLFSQNPAVKIEKQVFFSRKTFMPCFYIFLLWMAHMIMKNYANTITPNPSYVAALILTCPVWVMLAYKIVGHKEDANVKAGLGIMASAILLALLNLRG